MRALIYIILLILIYGYIAGYFLKNHQNYTYLESEVAAFNFRYISMIVLNLLVGYLYYTNLLKNNDNKISKYFGVILIGLLFVFISKYYSEIFFVNELTKSFVPLLIVIFIIIYTSNDILEDQSVGLKLIVAVLFIYCLTVLLTRNPPPFELESIKNMEKSEGLITLIPTDEIVQLDTNNKKTLPPYKLDYSKLDSFALSFSIYIESSGLKSINSDVSYDIIKLRTTDISGSRGNNIDFTINYDYVKKELVLNFIDSSFNNYITNARPPQSTMASADIDPNMTCGVPPECRLDERVNTPLGPGIINEMKGDILTILLDPDKIKSPTDPPNDEMLTILLDPVDPYRVQLPARLVTRSEVSGVVEPVVPPEINSYIVPNNSYIIPIKFNSNNLYKWHHILLNFTKEGIDIYSNNINFPTNKVFMDPLSNIVNNFSNYDNKLIKEIKFIKPPNYLDYKFDNIFIGNTDNLGNDYISLSKMIFYSRQLKSDELDKINNL